MPPSTSYCWSVHRVARPQVNMIRLHSGTAPLRVCFHGFQALLAPCQHGDPKTRCHTFQVESLPSIFESCALLSRMSDEKRRALRPGTLSFARPVRALPGAKGELLREGRVGGFKFRFGFKKLTSLTPHSKTEVLQVVQFALSAKAPLLPLAAFVPRTWGGSNPNAWEDRPTASYQHLSWVLKRSS